MTAIDNSIVSQHDAASSPFRALLTSILKISSFNNLSKVISFLLERYIFQVNQLYKHWKGGLRYKESLVLHRLLKLLNLIPASSEKRPDSYSNLYIFVYETNDLSQVNLFGITSRSFNLRHLRFVGYCNVRHICLTRPTTTFLLQHKVLYIKKNDQVAIKVSCHDSIRKEQDLESELRYERYELKTDEIILYEFFMDYG